MLWRDNKSSLAWWWYLIIYWLQFLFIYRWLNRFRIIVLETILNNYDTKNNGYFSYFLLVSKFKVEKIETLFKELSLPLSNKIPKIGCHDMKEPFFFNSNSCLQKYILFLILISWKLFISLKHRVRYWQNGKILFVVTNLYGHFLPIFVLLFFSD